LQCFNLTTVLIILIFVPLFLYAAIDVYIDRVEPEEFAPSAGEACTVWMTLTDDAVRLDVEVRDYQNSVVHSKMLTNLLKGTQRYSWDGRNAAGEVLPPGDYRIEVIARDAAGNVSRDFSYVTIVEEAAPDAAEEIPELPELTPPAVRPSGYFRTVGRAAEGETTFWEHRAQLQVDYDKNDLRLFARGDLRFTDERGWENDNSELGLNWTFGRLSLQVSMRDQLGRLDDPLQLYSDYARGRKSYGVALSSNFEGFNFNVIHSRSEGSKSNSTALRLTGDLTKGITLSGNYVLSIDEEGNDSSVYSVDASLKITSAVDLSGEVASSINTEGESGEMAYRMMLNYRRRNLSASIGYQDIAPGFSAESAYLPNGTSPDNHGLDLQVNYRASGDLLFIQRPSISLQLYNQATEEGEAVNEYRGNFRFNVFKRMSVGLDYQYADSPVFNRESGSLRLSSPLWQGTNISTRISYSKVDTYETLTFYGDASFLLFRELSVRLSYQWNEQKISETPDETDEETAEDYYAYDSYGGSSGSLLRIDTVWRSTHLLLQYRVVNKEEGEDNLYIRADQTFSLMERFTFTVYAAYGDLVSAQSRSQVELGVEARF